MNDAIVIVGASMGGLRVAESLRRFGYLGPIKIFGDEPHLPYNRPPLSKEVLADEVNHDAVAFAIRDSIGEIEWMLDCPITGIDTSAKTVTDKHGHKHNYSALVIATGLSAKELNRLPEGTAGVHVLRSLDHAINLRKELKPGAKVVIVGAGFIGCEVAATAQTLGCAVSVVGSGNVPLNRPLCEVFGAEVMRRQQEQGVKFFMNSGIADVAVGTEAGSPKVSAIKLVDGQQLDCDVVLFAIGSTPNTQWLASSGIDIVDGVHTNNSMQALDLSGKVVPDVYAIGDVARFTNPLFDGLARRVEHWNIPTETAKRAAKVIAAKFVSGEDFELALAEPFAPMPSFWSNQFEMQILGYGSPALATASKLIEGSLSEEFVFGYYRDDKLVGVAGIGMKNALLSYRMQMLQNQ